MAAVKVPNVPHIVEDRRMMSRTVANQQQLVGIVTPGRKTPGCLTCCNAPKFCPCTAFCPCCDDPEYIVRKREASRYVVLRENSIEWNEPQIIPKTGCCFGMDPCLYDVQDNVKVIYYDDQMFDRVRDSTRCCNSCRTFMCGGMGERVKIDSSCCCGACVRGIFPCCCVPSCCPMSCCPCALSHTLYVENAETAVYDIKQARDSAKQRLGVE